MARAIGCSGFGLDIESDDQCKPLDKIRQSTKHLPSMKATGMSRALHGSRLCREHSVCAGAAPTAAGGLRAGAVGRKVHCVFPPRSCRAAAEAGESMSNDTRTGEAWRAEWYNWWWAAANADALEVLPSLALVSTLTGLKKAPDSYTIHAPICSTRRRDHPAHPLSCHRVTELGFGPSPKCLPWRPTESWGGFTSINI
jgi:hypothetical protein